MQDQDGVVIFSAFDDKIGQVPLVHVGLDEESALKACNQISMSILATVSTIDSPEEFHGDSIVPLIDLGIVTVVSYFFIISDQLSEPSFSFIAYGVPLERKIELYAVMKELVSQLTEVASKAKSTVKLALPLTENSSIPDDTKQLILELARPLSSFQAASRDSLDLKVVSEDELDFVRAVALAYFDGGKMELHVPFSHGIDSHHVNKIAFRVILSLLMRLTKTRKKGEAIIPDVESNQIIFSYFFPVNDSLIGIIFIFASDEHKMILYRSAPLLANEVSRITEQLGTPKSFESISFGMKNRLMGLYYVNAAIAEQLRQQRTISAEESTYLRDPKPLFKFKNVEKMISSLITGHPLVLTSKYFADSQDLAYLLNHLAPHRDVTLVRVDDRSVSKAFRRWDVVYVPRDLTKKLPKDVTLVDVDKKKVSSSLHAPYVKRMIKQMEKLDSLDQITKLMKKEVSYLLDQVSRLVEVSKMEDETTAKEKVDEFLLNLPDQDMFDVIKELAISFNPILEDLINEKAVYVLRRDLWGI